MVTSSAPETRFCFVLFCFSLRNFNHFYSPLLHLCLLFLTFAPPQWEYSTKITENLRKKIWCALQNLQSFCVNLILHILEVDKKLFCCFTWRNVRAEEGGKWGHERQLKENHGAEKCPEVNGKAQRDTEIMCRGDNNPQRGTGKQTRKKKWAYSKREISLRNTPEWSNCRRV